MDAALEIKRIYEVRKYLDVDGCEFEDTSSPSTRSSFASISPTSSPLCDSLETIVELATLRLGAYGAFVALVGEDSHHLLAICKPEVETQDTPCKETQWMGATKEDRQAWLWLARQTLSAIPTATHGRRVYTSSRLDDMEQTAVLSCVAREPYARHFTAVPITTPRGLDIGYLAVIQTTFGGLNDAQLDFLERLSVKSMSLLGAARESHVQSRWSKMSRNLDEFLRNPDVHEELLEDPPLFSAKPDQREKGSEAQLHENYEPGETFQYIGAGADLTEIASDVQREERLDQESGRSEGAPEGPPKDSDSSTEDKEDRSSSARHPKKRETTYRRTFRRAARVLREALNVYEQPGSCADADGALFVDGVVGFHGPYMPTAELEPDIEVEIGKKPPNRARHDEENSDSGESNPHHSYSDREEAQKDISERVFTSPDFRKNVLTSHPGEILGIQYRDEKQPHLVEISSTTIAIPELDEGYLQYFLERYNQGRVWFFDKSGKSFHLEEDQLTQEPESEELQRLTSAFPGARQLIFCPLVNPVSLKSLAGFFTWTSSEAPLLTDTVDLAAIKNFCYMVEAEISRNDNTAAMKQQESFVASVSHELRTPLHGILGASQFLSDTTLDAFQGTLLETIDLCGSTLHQTLTSVLSYAKINQFERRHNKPRQDGAQESPWHLDLLSHHAEDEYDFHGYYEQANIVSLCEDVLSVVEAGRSYKSLVSRDVTVTMEAEYLENWNFITEPGAFRRVALNIVGNALKYTMHGTVQVSLRTAELKDDRPRIARTGPREPRRLVIFSCKDTGKGMTRSFIDRELFLPFSQEDPVSSAGVGLGMSIVKSLVTVLGGEIYVSSAVGRGTEIQVRLPMTLVSSESASQKPSHPVFEEDVQTLRKRNLGVVVHGFQTEEKISMDGYLTEWFKCRLLSADDPSVEPDLVIANEGDEEITEDFFKTTPRWGHRGGLLSITPARLTRPMIITDKDGVWERKPRPIGPKRFANALATCMAKVDEFRTEGRSSRERKIEEIGENGDIHRIGSGEIHSESKLPNDHNAEIPPSSVQPLPAAAKSEADQPPPTATFPARSLAIRVNSNRTEPRIMIVEDNSVNLRLLKIFVEKCGYHDVKTAVNGALAVAAAQASHKSFDIIFMDLSMPVMDGFEATRRIRDIEAERQASMSDYKPAHIVALTGLASKQDEQLAFSSGVDMFVTKPVKFKKLEVLFNDWETAQVETSSIVSLDCTSESKSST